MSSNDRKPLYTPISCVAYDVLESSAILKHELELFLKDGSAVRGMVRDVFSRGSEEFCLFESVGVSTPIRLDTIVSITNHTDGKSYATQAC